MALAKVLCTCKICGNEFEIRKAKRNRAEADDFKAWAIENITECRECRARRAHEEAMQEAEGLPQLTGSEKQISWAVDIRARVIRIIKSQYPLQLPDLDAVLKAKTKASWWIDERGRDESTLIDDAVKNDPQLEGRRREIVEDIKCQVLAEIETIAEAGTLKTAMQRRKRSARSWSGSARATRTHSRLRQSTALSRGTSGIIGNTACTN